MYRVEFISDYNGDRERADKIYYHDQCENILVDFSFDNDRLISWDYFIREPRQATLEFYADDWLKEKFLWRDLSEEIELTIDISAEGDGSDEQTIISGISKLFVRLYNNNDLLFTGCIDKSQTNYSYPKIKIKAYDPSYIFNIVSEKLIFQVAENDGERMPLFSAIPRLINSIQENLNLVFYTNINDVINSSYVTNFDTIVYELREANNFGITNYMNETYPDYIQIGDITRKNPFYFTLLPVPRNLTINSQSVNDIIFAGVISQYTSFSFNRSSTQSEIFYLSSIYAKIIFIKSNGNIVTIDGAEINYNQDNNDLFKKEIDAFFFDENTFISDFIDNLKDITLYNTLAGFTSDLLLPYEISINQLSFNFATTLYTISKKNQTLDWYIFEGSSYNFYAIAPFVFSGTYTYKDAIKMFLFFNDVFITCRNNGDIFFTEHDFSDTTVDYTVVDLIDYTVSGSSTSEEEKISGLVKNIYPFTTQGNNLVISEIYTEFQKYLENYYENILNNVLSIKFDAVIADDHDFYIGEVITIENKKMLVNEVSSDFEDFTKISGYLLGE